MSAFDLRDLRRPVIGAPMGGGPSTPALVAAVSAAGGLGFLAAGYQTPEGLAAQISELRSLTDEPFGVNVFAPPGEPTDLAAVTSYAAHLAGESERAGVALGRATGGDDHFAAKVELLAEDPVAVVSFAFGLPRSDVVDTLHRTGSAVWVTVTTPAEAARAAAAGVDALVAQGAEAGAHRGGFTDHDDHQPLADLMTSISSASPIPVIAAGGLMEASDVAAALGFGAAAVQLGTAFLRSPEAGTSEAHRMALATLDRPTVLTRAFTGRWARGIVNRFIQDHEAEAPAAYPHVHQLTAPLRAAARAAGDMESLHLWAGVGYRQAREAPAGEIVERLSTDI